MRRLLFVVISVWCLCVSGLAFAEDHPALKKESSGYQPKLAPASREGELAIKRFKLAVNLKVQLIAAEPALANPVAIWIDPKQRIYVAETYRQVTGVPDTRNFMGWLDDDLASMSVEDRQQFLRKHLKQNYEKLAIDHDRIKLLEDRDGDGKYETSRLFADGFHEALDGTGAGVIERKGTVWYTCIPHLWTLRDTDGDGKADERKIVQSGYGCRVAYRGHDLHGLRFGPDRRLYFSIGDRGFNVMTREGRRLFYPDQGAVLRCNPDGSELEVFATGLRNPQELAFDQYGNLFTGENNSDSGDKARWVYLLEGGDSGWRMNLQYIPDRGPWNREKLWHPQHAGQPAWIVPPIANLGDGPSGLTYYPGIGLPDRYRDHFFLADFRGTEGQSGIRSFAMKPRGAGFELTDEHQFVWSVLATDCDFGPDGSFYIADWVQGWTGEGKGRLYKVTDAEHAKSPVALQAATLFREGFETRQSSELTRLLEHPSRDIRQETQFELADRGTESVPLLLVMAVKSTHQMARLHAIWALEQIARREPATINKLIPLLNDSNPEVRAQVAKALGERRATQSAEGVLALLRDPSARVRYFTAIAAGRVAGARAIAPILEMLKESADRDPFLRHGGVMGLAATEAVSTILEHANDPVPAARMGVLLALRRLQRPEVVRFLHDAEPRLVDEAARAINDVPINDGWKGLADLFGSSQRQKIKLSESTLYRVINANFRLGEAANAATVAEIAAREEIAAALRVEAVKALANWTHPFARDRVLWLWRPLPDRPAKIATQALRSNLLRIFAGPREVQLAATTAAVQMQIAEAAPLLIANVRNVQHSTELRLESLRGLETLKAPQLDSVVDGLLADFDPKIRAEARRLIVKRQPEAAVPLLAKVLDSGATVERQQAIISLGEIASPSADAVLLKSFERLAKNQLTDEVLLELLQAAGNRKSPQLAAKLTEFEQTRKSSSKNLLLQYRESLLGGDAERGRKLFLASSDTSCVRCHKVGERGGQVGPELSHIGSQKTREYLLEAILDPNKQIAQGFETVILQMTSGKVYIGIVRESTEKELRLIQPDNSILTLQKADIEEQTKGASAMPEDVVKKLTKSELRDLVEFLARLK